MYSINYKLISYRDDCLQENLMMDSCRYGNGSHYQNWKYDLDTKQVISLWQDQWCLSAAFKEVSIFLAPCNSSDVAQKWTFGSVDDAALKIFDKFDFKQKMGLLEPLF